jgi:hypothetical protein
MIGAQESKTFARPAESQERHLQAKLSQDVPEVTGVKAGLVGLLAQEIRELTACQIGSGTDFTSFCPRAHVLCKGGNSFLQHISLGQIGEKSKRNNAERSAEHVAPFSGGLSTCTGQDGNPARAPQGINPDRYQIRALEASKTRGAPRPHWILSAALPCSSWSRQESRCDPSEGSLTGQNLRSLDQSSHSNCSDDEDKSFKTCTSLSVPW